MKLCSACLLGIKCRYDGESKPNEKVISLSKKEVLIPVCPEQLGGLPTPRIPAEPQACSGEDILEGKGIILNKNGVNVSQNFIQGAKEVLKIADIFGIKQAILKQRSPSCGCGKIPDGAFSGNIVKGDGVTSALLKKNGIEVVTEEDL